MSITHPCSTFFLNPYHGISSVGRVLPILWDDLGEVMVVGCASVGESVSLPVLGERIETGWEHRTLCKKRRDALPQLTPQSLSQLPCSQLLGRDEGPGSLVEPFRPEKGFPCKIKLSVLDTTLPLVFNV